MNSPLRGSIRSSVASFLQVTEAIKRRKAQVDALREDHLRAGNPIGPLGVDHVAKIVERAEGLRALVRRQPWIGEPAEQGAEGRRRPGENLDGVIEGEFHRGVPG